MKKINPFVFTRVSNTEAHLHFYSVESKTFSFMYGLIDTKEKIDDSESLFRTLAEKFSSEEEEFITVSSARSLDKTVLMEASPHSKVRPAIAKNALAAPKLALIRHIG